jgi:tRNA threonylcarbamoyladenosine biosynthesis protein TsaB
VRILAIDTATECCSAALLLDGTLSTREQRLERGHAKHLLPMVDELLREADVALGSLAAVAFGRGPGAFTGVRLAASVAQGLAFGADLPVVAVSDLRSLAQRALEALPEVSRVLASLDARMHEVYWASFERGPEQLATAVGEEFVGPPAAVRLPLSWQRDGASGVAARHPAGLRVCGAGTGFTAYPDLRKALEAVDPVLEQLLPRAQEVARLAVPEVRAGRVLSAEQALPVYLRDDVTHKRSVSH